MQRDFTEDLLLDFTPLRQIQSRPARDKGLFVNAVWQKIVADLLRRCAISILIIFISSFSFAQPGELIWSDDFNSGSLDLTKWSYEIGTGVNGDWGTGQLDRATNRPENVSFRTNVPGAEDACRARRRAR